MLHVYVSSPASPDPDNLTNGAVLKLTARLRPIVALAKEDGSAIPLIHAWFLEEYGADAQYDHLGLRYEYVYCPDIMEFKKVCIEEAKLVVRGDGGATLAWARIQHAVAPEDMAAGGPNPKAGMSQVSIKPPLRRSSPYATTGPGTDSDEQMTVTE